MKKTIYILLVIMLYACAENSKNNETTNFETNSSQEINEESISSKDNSNENVNSQLNDLLNMGQGLLEQTQKNENSIKLDNASILDLLEKSGASREDMEKLLNNPDSLSVLAKEVKEDRLETWDKKPSYTSKISKAQVASKDTPTGTSIEEAILQVQAESKSDDITKEKLKRIDKLAGTTTMSQLDLKEGQHIVDYVERKHEPKPSTKEAKDIERITLLSEQLHSENEAKEMIANLEQIDKKIKMGTLKASPKYHRAVTYSLEKAKISQRQITQKAKVAKQKFKKLNPDLYFGETAGNTYLGNKKKAVYLPLGKLAFADEVIAVNHPENLTKDHKEVLGEPDFIHADKYNYISPGMYSLGHEGDLTVQFIDNALTNVNGPDLYIFEIGTVEPTDLEISKDGVNWVKVGKIDGGVAEVDIEPYVKQGELFYYVKLKDLKKLTSLPGADVDAIAAIGSAMRLNLDSQVLFDSGKSELKPEGIEALKKLVSSITVLKKGEVIIEGHTDDVGSDTTNNALSLARAKSVSNALKAFIPSSQFTWQEKGYGETKPLVENNSDENRTKNRRVEILVLPN